MFMLEWYLILLASEPATEEEQYSGEKETHATTAPATSNTTKAAKTGKSSAITCSTTHTTTAENKTQTITTATN